MTSGYHGAYLRIDLGSGKATRMPIDAGDLRRFIGGSGLGVSLLLREGAATMEPLAAEAPLAFVFSPLVGSPLTTSAKFAVVSKSPLTGRINDSLASSGFAIAGKQCGCDALLLTGRAAEPSILIVDDANVRIVPAGDAWGLDVEAAAALLRKRLGGGFQTAVIGPAGERLVRYATISHDNRHAGRGGSGTVMGSKNLKAIAVRGTQRVKWAFPDELAALARDVSARSFGPATEKYRELGTISNLLAFNRFNALPTRNFQQGAFHGAEALSAEQLTATRQKTRTTCAACGIGCEHIYSIHPVSSAASQNGDGHEGVRLEYENLFALGPLCGIGDASTVLQASKFCDRAGLDTVSAGGTIAFAMQCVERGLLDAPWLRFGDGDALLRALDETAHRRGLGQQLAEGSRRLAERLGNGAIEFAPQVKGLELPGYEPRALQMMALGFAVGTRGADHNRSGAYEVDFSDRVDRRNVRASDAVLAVETEDKAALTDSLILCKFLRGIFDDFYGEAAEMLRLTTGWDVTAEELRTTAKRIVAAKKLFNIRAGWTPEEDTLPARFLDRPLPGDPRSALSRQRLTELVAAYNLARGWSAEGWIADELLAELGLPATMPATVS